MPPVTDAIDQYLAAASPAHRRLLERLRGTIRAVAPQAVECISYGIPTFKQDGQPLVAFGAWAEHCALYPMSGKAVAALGDALDGFSTSKGTIRFTVKKPLPVAIVKSLVKTRLAEIAAKPKRAASKPKAAKKSVATRQTSGKAAKPRKR